MIYVTHDQEDALTLATKIALLRAGSVEQVGTPQELYDAPSTRYAAEFLGRANILECSVAGPLEGADLRISLPAAGGATVSARRGAYRGVGSPALCIRPEHVVVQKPSRQQGKLAISATVSHVSYKGAHLDIQCETSNGERVLSRAAPDEQSVNLRAGDRVSLSWPTNSSVVVGPSVRARAAS